MLGWPYTFVNKYNIQCPQKSVTLEWKPPHSSQQAYEDRIRKKIGTNRCVQKLVNKSKFSKGAHTTNFAIWLKVPYVCAQPYDPGSDNNGSFLAPSPSEFKTARQKLELAIFLYISWVSAAGIRRQGAF